MPENLAYVGRSTLTLLPKCFSFFIVTDRRRSAVVLCCVIVCSKRFGRDNVKFFRIPAVITRRGERERELSEIRRREFLAAIGRADLKGTKFSNARMCSLLFVSGSPANLFDDTNVDWIPTMKLRLRGQQKANEQDESV